MNPKKVVRKILPKSLITVGEETYRKSRLAGAHLRYGLPAKHLRVIAITGTNGKTSTCNFLNDVLISAGYSTAMYSTAVIEIGGERQINTHHSTVPPVKELFNFLRRAKDLGVDFVILETTSHALHQHKLWGIPIEIAVMTNLTQDHLDYHGTMQNYAEAKARLFSDYMKPRWCVLNADDTWFDYFKSISTGQIYTYGKAKNNNLRISSTSLSSEGVRLRFELPKSSIIAISPVIGEFNAYNLASVVAVADIVGIAPDVIRKALGKIRGVPGRMEIVRSSQGFSAVVDYAHAPDALEKALIALRATTKGRVSVVFGATGDRDTTKRPIMGTIAGQLADKIYLTDDETYTENGDTIRKAVMAGIVESGARNKTIEIADRAEAIKCALVEAKKGDMILIAGLGHQDYRAMNEGNIPWQETEIVKSILAQLDKA
jgi:UDP-N-acetylmuramoyl-L-alanyl-D-glutamate--2,6-diaminopimelate ligase